VKHHDQRERKGGHHFRNKVRGEEGGLPSWSAWERHAKSDTSHKERRGGPFEKNRTELWVLPHEKNKREEKGGRKEETGRTREVKMGGAYRRSGSCE